MELSTHEHTWQLKVTEQLATLIQQTTGLAEQVKRQNGNVAKLWEHMDSVEKHPGECPLHVRVAQLETAVSSDRAAREAASRASGRTSRAWEGWVRPALMALVTFLLGLAARNMGDLMKAVR